MRALHTAATGMMAQELNVQVISNNIANMRTTGYKTPACRIPGPALRARPPRRHPDLGRRATSCPRASSSARASRPSARRAS